MAGKWQSGCLYSILVAFSVVLLYLVAALFLGSIPVNSSYAQAREGIKIFVTDNGVHTDFVLPVNAGGTDWRTSLPLQDYAGADSSYTHVAFGWGDRRFYMETPEWKDLRLDVAFTALFWPTRSAMHVEYIPRPLTSNKYQRPLILTEAQYQLLVNYITGTFKQKNGEFILIKGAGYTSEDNFYEANGRFHLFRNCNNWTNRGLKTIGVKTAFWAPLPFAIMRHLR